MNKEGKKLCKLNQLNNYIASNKIHCELKKNSYKIFKKYNNKLILIKERNEYNIDNILLEIINYLKEVFEYDIRDYNYVVNFFEDNDNLSFEIDGKVNEEENKKIFNKYFKKINDLKQLNEIKYIKYEKPTRKDMKPYSIWITGITKKKHAKFFELEEVIYYISEKLEIQENIIKNKIENNEIIISQIN